MISKRTPRSFLVGVFYGLAVLVPLVTAVLTWQAPSRVLISVADPFNYKAIDGPFLWRFCRWQFIFGDNSYREGFAISLIDILHPTLLHLSLAFLVVALILRRNASRKSMPSSPGQDGTPQ
jgi:hypothetical protein